MTAPTKFHTDTTVQEIAPDTDVLVILGSLPFIALDTGKNSPSATGVRLEFKSLNELKAFAQKLADQVL
jgi:hypothetical protein